MATGFMPINKKVVNLGSFRRPASTTDRYAKAVSDARTANESRYTDILGRYEQLAKQLQGLGAGMGAGAASDIDARSRDRRASTGQWAADRGLTNTTAYRGRLGRSDAIAGREHLALQGQLAQFRSSSLLQGMGPMLQFMERRTDAYPDARQYGDLFRQRSYAQAANPY